MKTKFIMLMAIAFYFSALPIASAICGDINFVDGVDLNSGKLHYRLAEALYLSQACSDNNLVGDVTLVPGDFSEGAFIAYYSDSLLIKNVTFLQSGEGINYYYKNNSLLKMSYTEDGEEYLNVNFIYNNGKLSRMIATDFNGELYNEMNFIYEENMIVIFNNYSRQVFQFENGKVKNISLELLETGPIFESFEYYDSLVRTLGFFEDNFIYDKNSEQMVIETGAYQEFEKYIVYEGEVYQDICISESQLKDYYRGLYIYWDFWNIFAKKEVRNKIVDCKFGCEYGSCKNALVEETCYDGLWNQNEAGVDCGGPCQACAPVIEIGEELPSLPEMPGLV